jgi:RNA polymerase sigma factor (sigma-70 family)
VLTTEQIADRALEAARLYDELAPYVRRLVRGVMGADSKQHDLVQDVFCRVLRDFEALRDRNKLRPWVRAITFSVVFDELRRRRATRTAIDNFETTLVADLGHAMEARDLLARLKSMLERLPAAERSAFMMRYVEHRTVPEIARLEGYSIATAHRRLRRPRRLLKAFLSQNVAGVGHS